MLLVCFVYCTVGCSFGQHIDYGFLLIFIFFSLEMKIFSFFSYCLPFFFFFLLYSASVRVTKDRAKRDKYTAQSVYLDGTYKDTQ